METKDTISDLLVPRYKVIAGYPDSVLRIGEIIIPDNGIINLIEYYHCADYPHLFKPLQWWEDRNPKEMPQYIKSEGVVYKIKDWDNYSAPYVYIVDGVHTGYRKGCEYTPLYGSDFEPATESEYLNHVNKRQ